jgi:hypothetical protein
LTKEVVTKVGAEKLDGAVKVVFHTLVYVGLSDVKKTVLVQRSNSAK